MITVPVIQAFFLGALRLGAMGAALYLYKDARGDAVTLGAAALFAGFAVTGQVVDVLAVAKQVASAQTTTSVTLQQPADAPSPVQLVAKTQPASIPQPQQGN